MEVDEEDCAPHDPTVKIVGLPGQTRGSIGVIVQLGKRNGGKGAIERLGFSGGTVGFSTVKEVSTDRIAVLSYDARAQRWRRRRGGGKGGTYRRLNGCATA